MLIDLLTGLNWNHVLILLAVSAIISGVAYVIRKFTDEATFGNIATKIVACMVETENFYRNNKSGQELGEKKMDHAIKLVNECLTSKEKNIAVKHGTLRTIAQSLFPIVQTMLFKRLR